MNTLDRDRQLITANGGPVKLAEKLNMGRWGAQRVSNWNRRGIPAAVKVQYPAIFMPELAPTPASRAQAAIETVAGVANV